MEMHVDTTFGRRQGDHAAGLRGAHHRGHVELREHPFDSHHLRMMGVQPVLDGIADGQQALRQGRIRRCAHHVDIQRGELPTTPTR